ncbi:Hypothetical protein MVR_LOCUS26 [uncultured virus]|nr:Hypothetical protein MVR_LOCUS26 [uncultured virus]
MVDISNDLPRVVKLGIIVAIRCHSVAIRDAPYQFGLDDVANDDASVGDYGAPNFRSVVICDETKARMQRHLRHVKLQTPMYENPIDTCVIDSIKDMRGCLNAIWLVVISDDLT